MARKDGTLKSFRVIELGGSSTNRLALVRGGVVMSWDSFETVVSILPEPLQNSVHSIAGRIGEKVFFQILDRKHEHHVWVFYVRHFRKPLR